MLLLFCFALLCFVFRLYAFVEAAALRSIVLRYAGAPIATRVSFFFSFCLFGDIAFSEYFLYHFPFLFEWRVRRTFFPSECFFSTLRPRAGFLTLSHVRIQSNQSIKSTPRPSEYPPVMGGKMSCCFLHINRSGLNCLVLYAYFSNNVVVVFFTLTDRASIIPSNILGCQSGTWSQRGIKANGSHHGDNPLLTPTGIQIATKSMRLYKQWHLPISIRFIKPHYSISRAASIYLSLTHGQCSQQQSGQITLQPVWDPKYCTSKVRTVRCGIRRDNMLSVSILPCDHGPGLNF